jgi:sporulation protein YlmC with PRC-barrel domain
MKALIDVTEDLEIVRDILDQQVMDRDDNEMGRVDGLRLEIREGKAPRIHSIEMGGVALARRLHPRLAPWVDGWRRRFDIRKVEVYSVPWSAVIEVNERWVKLDVEALESPALDWERWLREHVIAHIPAAAKGNDEE